MYSWVDELNGAIASSPDGSSITICASDNINIVTLTIVDGNGCMSTSTINIEYVVGPNVNIVPSDPDLCAGVPIVMEATTTYPDPLTYAWSTGQTSQMITVGLEGTYYVTVTDPITGCSAIDFIIVNPLPDLCIVPKGCYKACDPDTLCAPLGLTDYEWYFNGVIDPAYSGMQCIIVSESGEYNFEGTNSFGCSDISETLYLELVPCCRPGDTEITAIPDAEIGLCCYRMSYELNQDIFYSFDMYSADADLNLDLSSVDPSLGVLSSLPSLISFESSTSGDPLSQGPVFGFANICLENVTSSPAIIVVDWKGEDGDVLCSDTLMLECEVEPDCIYIAQDSIYCNDMNEVVYEVTICNPADAEYEIGYIDIIEISPAGALLDPSAIDLTGSPLLPGDCMDFTFSISGSLMANDSLKFTLVGHQFNPFEDPSTLCCTSEETYCVFIPGCTPCDMTFVSSIDTSDLGDCCYDVTINNYFSASAFTGIDICVITPDAEIDIVNPFGSPWDLISLSGTNAELDYTGSISGTIPLGDVDLPTICIAENTLPYVDIVIKWKKNNNVECMDTITLLCEGDCGYMTDFSLVCGPDGQWIFTGSIVNTSPHAIHSAYIDWGIDALNPFDLEIDLGSLDPGETSGSILIIMDIPSEAVDELCVTTTLHTIGHSDLHEDCCNFKTIIEVPDCGFEPLCECGAPFLNAVNQGIDCNQTSDPLVWEFTPLGNLTDCDAIIWNWKKQQIAYQTIGNETLTHTFPSFGEYEFCIEVTRTTPDGKQCQEEYCKEVDVFEVGAIIAYPNPANDFITIDARNMDVEMDSKIELFDVNNRKCYHSNAKIGLNPVQIDVSDLHPGIYILKVESMNITTTNES